MDPEVRGGQENSREILAAMARDLEPQRPHRLEPGPVRFQLTPVENKAPWVWPGLALELIGVAAPAAYVLIKAKNQNFGGSLTPATVKLSWHQSVHSKAGLAVLIGGAVVVAIGAALVARPWVPNALVWLLAVPLAAAAGALLLGVGMLIIVFIGAIVFYGLGDFGDGGGAARRKKKPADRPAPWSAS
ncbi:MAG TPA: hypothetical protein VMU90_12935 [Solirubrobacteraceae bacterium]|nr:hypothetical protein [Solirubrobacteraceae bacterium]